MSLLATMFLLHRSYDVGWAANAKTHSADHTIMAIINPDQPDLEAWMNTQGSTFDIASLITYTARDPKLSLAYNYATLILNNSYFLEGIVSRTCHPLPTDVVWGRVMG